ncbi:signal peptidase I [Tamilnaduibacter salinus]|uniref:Signal peptidase I n=1 Tax=Tamilnaduibacter salinus TaxID=1484056 RepID=A0A2A2I7U3_9GAMM|nr:signal peptidase I [Tamilnaduibacter salinus]PAV27185.1 signal peptidase I [Tamilnaduibacter salinus]PVY78981.1 signal peptidase I [Tamilnaduibacter salinus]
MDINFPLILVTLTFATGFIWLGDRLFFKARREAALGTGETAATGVSETGKEEGDERREPYLVDLSRSFFPVLAIVLVLRSFLVEPFQIPSGSMRPTLEVGDFILVNKFAYGLRLPVLRNEVVDLGDPERGDIMVFRYPKDGETNYIKRVIGLPGDRIRYRNHDLFINGEKVATDFVATLPPFELKHEMLGNVRHDIMVSIRETGRQGNGAWTIPEGEYFVMGDNRDNSNDSRFWGTVPDRLVVGKAFAIWMHWESLFSLPEFNRVGLIE